jgi:hypothetical protein
MDASVPGDAPEPDASAPDDAPEAADATLPGDTE